MLTPISSACDWPEAFDRFALLICVSLHEQGHDYNRGSLIKVQMNVREFSFVAMTLNSKHTQQLVSLDPWCWFESNKLMDQ
jgi:hypothetical protein